MGTKLVMRDQYAEELRNDDRFAVYEAFKDVLFFSCSPLWTLADMIDLQVALVELLGFETWVPGGFHNHVSTPAVHALNRNISKNWNKWCPSTALLISTI